MIISQVKKLCILLLLILNSWCPPVYAQISSTPLRVATKPFAPFAFEQNGQYVGFSIDLWKEIAQELNIQYQLYEEATVTDLLNAVRQESADIGIAGITITAEREETVDFSHSFFESGLQIMVSNQADSPFASLLLLLFSPIFLQTIGFIAFTTFIAANLIWYVERKKNSDMFPRDYGRGIIEALWWAVVTVVTVGYGDKVPKNVAGRLIAAIWMFSGILLISYFTASITSALTVQQLRSDITQLSDLIGKQVATIQGSTAADYLTNENRGINVLAFQNADEAFASILEKKANAVVYDSPVLLFYANGDGAGKVKVVGGVFQKQSYGIALKQGSPYREPINQALLKLKEEGNYDQLYKKWFGEDK